MADNRTRSEYRGELNAQVLAVEHEQRPKLPPQLSVVHLGTVGSEALARLMLEAYRGTIDDEGETMVEAHEAVAHLQTHCIDDHSFVLIDGVEGASAVAMSLVLTVGEVHYIDPVAVAAPHKGAGLGRRMVVASLASASAAGITEMGASITDGNEPSERLFASLGFTRVGPWPPQAPPS